MVSKSSTSKVRLYFPAGQFYLPKRTGLKGFLLRQLEKEGKSVNAINYIFCSDSFLLEMNRQYLKHDTLTDIITFELSGKGEAILSDIYISVDRVRENARKFKAPFFQEIHRVIFHGALHLCGYKDKSKTQRKLMRQAEDEWLSLYDNVPREKSLYKD